MKRVAVLALLLATPFAGAALGARARQASPKTAEHALLEQMVGTWNAEVKAGDAVEKGTNVARLGMGGLWLTSDFDGQLMGAPFQGHQILGWDPEKKKYVGCWVDSMASALTLTEGTWDATRKSLTMESLEPDPMTGQKMLNVSHFESHDKHVFTMYPGSLEAPPIMTITYTRKK